MLGTKLHIDPVEEFGGGVSPWWLSALLLLIALIYCLYKGEKDGTKIFLIILPVWDLRQNTFIPRLKL